MTSRLAFWRKRKQDSELATTTEPSTVEAPSQVATIALDIAPNDPFLAYCQHVAGVIDVEKLSLDSPAVQELQAANIRLVIPLVSQGDLIGLINLCERLSEQDY